MSKKVIFTGITPTGKLTIGHYFAIIKEIIRLQKNYEVIVMIADLHALTTIEEEKINYKDNSRVMAAILYPCGLECKIFIQSEIPYHLYLSHIISSYIPVNKLRNMIQYKEKKDKLGSSAAILNYPILMVADIILYNPDLVIVGKDQKQHLELNSYVLKKFEKEYPNLFNKPEYYIPSLGGKIMDLKNPLKKMSKSDSNSIFLLEEEESLEKKIMGSKTDSFNNIIYDLEKRPEISNLITIYSLLEDISIEECQERFKEKNYYQLKKGILELIKSLFSKIKEKYNEISKNIDDVLDKNNKYIKEIAKERFEKIKKAINI